MVITNIQFLIFWCETFFSAWSIIILTSPVCKVLLDSNDLFVARLISLIKELLNYIDRYQAIVRLSPSSNPT